MRRAALLALTLATAAAQAAELPQFATVAAGEAPTVRPGGSATLRVSVSVTPGYHVQANPVLNPYLIPLLLEVTGTADVRVGPPVYPPAKRMRLAGDEQDLVIYDGTFVIEQPVTVSPGSPPGEVMLEGSLRYQACDDHRCLRPRTVPVRLRLVVGPTPRPSS